MRKKIATLVCSLVVVAMIFGACAQKESVDTAIAGQVPNNDASIIVAEVDGEPIYKDEFNQLFAGISELYGLSDEFLEDEAYASTIRDLKEQILNSVISDKIMFSKLKEKGYMNLSNEQLIEAEQRVQDELDDYSSYDMSYIIAELGEDYTDEQLQAKIIEFQEQLLEAAGITKEERVDYRSEERRVGKECA